MRLTEPAQAYCTLWRELTGQKASPAHAETLLRSYFSSPRPDSRACVVVMDELDLLVTKKQTVVYNFFEWPNLKHSKLVVVAIANTMDLPERLLTNKVSSRLGTLGSKDLYSRLDANIFSSVLIPAADRDFEFPPARNHRF